MRQRYGIAVVALAAGTWLGAGRARAQGLDYPTFHGGPSMSPAISCLMWSAAGSSGFSSSDEANVEGYLTGLTSYLSNAATPPGGTGAGMEPTPRQYNVWGAYFPSPCVQDTSSQGDDGDPDVFNEVTYAQQNLGLAPYSDTNLTVVFVKGAHYTNTHPCAEHFGLELGYVVVVYPDMCTEDPRVAASRQIFDIAADPFYNGWYNEEDGTQTKGTCPQVGHRDVSDDGVIGNVSFATPVPDAFNQVYTVDDDIDQLTGDYDNCGSKKGGTLFTNVTTTPAIATAQRHDKATYLDAIARTPTGLVHLVSNDNGVSFREVSPAPVGQVTELPSVFSPDGRTLQMYGRGLDGALYHWSYTNGAGWSGPDWVGGYMIGPPSAAFANVNGTRTTAVFMLGTNGKIAVVANGNWWWVQMPQFVLSVTPPQVFARNSTCLDLYFAGNDGKMYMDPCWTGNWHTVPGIYGLVTQLTRNPRVDVFGRPPIGQSGATPYWLEYNSGTLGSHGYLPLPVGNGTIAAVGLAPTVTKLFYTVGNYINATKSDPTGTVFNNWGRFDDVAVTSPPTALSPDGTAIVMFDRRQSDGHLVKWRFDGTSWTSVTDLGVSIM